MKMKSLSLDSPESSEIYNQMNSRQVLGQSSSISRCGSGSAIEKNADGKYKIKFCTIFIKK